MLFKNIDVLLLLHSIHVDSILYISICLYKYLNIQWDDTFLQILLGVRFNVPIDFLILTLVAHDADAEAGPVIYKIEDSMFTSSKFKSEELIRTLPFVLNATSGELRINSNIMEFVDGYFTLDISASNGPSSNAALNIIKVCEKILFSMYGVRLKSKFTSTLVRSSIVPSHECRKATPHFCCTVI